MKNNTLKGVFSYLSLFLSMTCLSNLFLTRANAGQNIQTGTCFFTRGTSAFEFEPVGVPPFFPEGAFHNETHVIFSSSFPCEGDTPEGLTGEFEFESVQIQANFISGNNTFVQTGTFTGTLGEEELSVPVKSTGRSADLAAHFVSSRIILEDPEQGLLAILTLDFEVPGCFPEDEPGVCNPRYTLKIHP